MITSRGRQGAPYCSMYGRELLSKPAISSNKCWKRLLCDDYWEPFLLFLNFFANEKGDLGVFHWAWSMFRPSTPSAGVLSLNHYRTDKHQCRVTVGGGRGSILLVATCLVVFGGKPLESESNTTVRGADYPLLPTFFAQWCEATRARDPSVYCGHRISCRLNVSI